MTLHRKRKLMVHALLALSCIIPFLMVWVYFDTRLLPLGWDPGTYLKFTNALEADVAIRLGLTSFEEAGWKLLPMWGQDAWQYPPLFFILLSIMSKLIDPVLSLKLLGTLALSLQPIPAFLLARRIAKSNLAGLLAAYGSSMTPLYIEMMGWGSYTNLLGFLLMGFAIYSTLCALENPSKGSFVKAASLSMLLVLAHHLTFLIYVGVLAGWVLLTILFRKKHERIELHAILVSLGSAISFFLLYNLLLAWPLRYTLLNESAYYELRFEPLGTMGIQWVFKDYIPMITTGLVVLAMFFGIKGALDKRYLTLLFSWSAFPSIATLGFLFGVMIDYNRVFYFAIQPIIVLIATPIALIHNSNRKLELTPLFRLVKKMLSTMTPFKVNHRRLGAYALIALSILASLSIFVTGFTTIGNVYFYNTSIDPYGDREKQEALNWIARNTMPNDIFVAEGLIASWIEGFNVRRAFLYEEPRFLFIEGELDRYYIASSIFESNYEARNCYVRVLDQAPYNTALSPQIQFWSKGRYREYLSFNDVSAFVRVSLNGKPLIISSFHRINVTASAIKSSDNKVMIEVTYKNSLVMLEKRVLITKDSPKVVVEYVFSPVSPSVTLSNATVVAFLSDERRIDLIEAGLGWARVVSDVGSMLVSAQNAYVIADQKTAPTKGLYMIFSSGADGSIRGVIEVSLMEASEHRCSSSLEAHSREELLGTYDISYIVLPRALSFGITTLPKYQHLLDDRRLGIVYFNDRVIILRAP